MPITVSGCTYPTNAEFRMIEMELLRRGEEDRLAFQLMPTNTTNADRLITDQPDVVKGLQQWRGLKQGSQFTGDGRANPYGKRCEFPAGYWGEHDVLEEDLLTRGAAFGTCAAPFDLTEHTTRMDVHLLERQLNRQEFNIWRALIFGIYEAYNSSGQLVYQHQFNIQTVAPAVPWGERNFATPLADFRFIRRLGRGTSADFGLGAVYIMNQTTADCLFSNTNPNDIGKGSLTACCTFIGPELVNSQFKAQGLGTIMIYDQGYVDEARNFNLFIPDGYVLIIGPRTNGQPVGNYWYTRNAVGCSITSGPWQKVLDTCERAVPREISIHRGHNGGPLIDYPRSVVVLNTGCTNDSVRGV